MKTIWRFLKYGLLSLLGLILLFVLGVAVFMSTSPEFGAVPTEEQIALYEELDHFNNGVFENKTPTSLEISFSQGIGIMRQQLNGVPNGEPDFEVPTNAFAMHDIDEKAVNVVWFGHSAFLVTIGGKTILLDPMMGDVPAPVSFLGPHRFTDLPIQIEEIPHVDAIFISHDHYDHLDYGSIKKLEKKTDHFFVPLGVGEHFRSWGIDDDRITELDWWNETNLGNLKVVFTPSRHFSGRGFARNETLWGSWIIKADSTSIFFSGDGGYGPHFKEIGNKYGPFDLALMECGQYNELWSQIHMMPEETAQAAVDVNANLLMPIHWGSFQLALHSWTDPIDRVTVKADNLGMPWIAPKIGEVIRLNSNLTFKERWWKSN